MMELRPTQTSAPAEVLRSDGNPAIKPWMRSQSTNQEAEEAIKLLSAEIMDAYGLCRQMDRSSVRK
jgi:hypothetical protein